MNQQPTLNTTDQQRIDRIANAFNAALADMDQPTAIRVNDPAIPSWTDGPRVGDTPTVWQDDKRIVPAWAAGIAVASIGVGAGITGVGCGAWLILQGLASVTLNGVLMVTLPFAGVAMVLTALGGLFKSLRGVHTTNHHHYNGAVDQRTVNSNTRGLIARTRNELPPAR